MKKLYNLMLLIAAVIFASCSDIPAPYELILGEGDIVELTPEGSGTAADPFNVAAANLYIEDGGDETATVYIKGIVYSIDQIDTSFGNATFYISDTGKAVGKLEVYRAYSLGNKKFTSEDELAEGDEVVICGKLVNYNGTYEVTQGGYVYSRNGVGGGAGDTMAEAKGTGTETDPFNVSAAIKKCQETGETATAEQYYVKGKVKSVDVSGVAQYGNINIDMVDEGTTAVFKAFQIYSFKGAKFTDSTAATIKEGDEVVVIGNLVNFKGNTPETTGKGAGHLVSLNGKTEGGNDNPEPPTEGLFSQSFASSLGNFQSIGNNAGITWYNDYSSACVTGYKDYNGDGTKENQAGVTYLVSPEIDLTSVANAYVKIDQAINYEKGDLNANNSILIASNYTGDPTTTSWTQLTYPTTGLGSSFSFVENKLNIPAELVGKKVRLAFRHTCSDASSSTWEVKSVAVLEGKAEDNGGGNGGNSDLAGDVVITFADMGWANSYAPTTETIQGVTFAFEGGGNTNVPKFYTNGNNVRMYPKNSVKVDATKKIEKITFKCDVVSGVNCVAEGKLDLTSGKVVLNGQMLTVENISNQSVTITNAHTGTGTVSQLRILAIAIKYAE